MTSNQAIVFYLQFLQKTAVEIRGHLHAEQKQSQSGSDTGYKSLIAHLVSTGIFHPTATYVKGTEVLSRSYST